MKVILRNTLTDWYWSGAAWDATRRRAKVVETGSAEHAALRYTWSMDHVEELQWDKPRKIYELRGERVYHYKSSAIRVERRQSGDGVYKRRKSWSEVSINGKPVVASGVKDAVQLIDKGQG